MRSLRREQKRDSIDRFEIVWSGGLLTHDSQTKGELLPRYARKEATAETSARLIAVRKHRSAG